MNVIGDPRQCVMMVYTPPMTAVFGETAADCRRIYANFWLDHQRQRKYGGGVTPYDGLDWSDVFDAAKEQGLQFSYIGRLG